MNLVENRLEEPEFHANAITRANMLNKMAVTFLSQSQESFEVMMTEGVRLIADIMNLDRMSIWRNSSKPDGLHSSQIYRWDKESGGTTVPTPSLEDVAYSQLAPGWDDLLSNGKTINGPSRLLSTNEAAMLKDFGVVSLFITPVFINSAFWGFVLFEDRREERYFDDASVEILRSAGFLCANAVIRADMERKVEEAVAKLTAANKAKSEFLSNMSHEIRTPMNAIINMTIIAKNTDNIEKKNFALDKIGDASTHLLGIINDILDMSKIEANKFELAPVEFNFEKMLQQVVNVVNFRIEEKHQQLTLNIDSNIPEILIGDDQRLSQVITNLLINAIKFTPDDGSIDIEARFLNEEDNVCTIQIAIIDTGIGISREQQKRLFQSFQQAETNTARKYGGTGLGLSISKNIVEMMGGSIWVQSELGKGSTFAFTVKAVRGEIQAEEETAKKYYDNKIDFSGHRILLAEDIEINREIVLTILEPTKLEIDCAENGIQAVEMFIEEPTRYEMILMDVQMPGMDGYEATGQIRAFEANQRKAMINDSSQPELQRGIPIIAMTANVFKEDIENCINAGMDDHIGKPLDFDIVMNKLRAYLK